MPDFSGLGATAYETAGAVTASSGGTTLTANASANTKGAYTQLIASTAYPASWLQVILTKPDSSDEALIDIAVGAAASEQVIIPNLGFASNSVTSFLSNVYMLPVSIPAGSRISARFQSAGGGSKTIQVIAYAISGSMMNPSGMGAVTAFGVTTASSTGTAVDPGGTANTKGSYVEFSASTAYPIKWLNVFVGALDTSIAAEQFWLMDIAIGAAASEQVIIANLITHITTAFDRPLPNVFSLPVSIPAGSRLSARCQCSVNTASDRVLNMIMYGVS